MHLGKVASDVAKRRKLNSGSLSEDLGSAGGSGDVILEKGEPRPLEEWETVVGDDFSLYYDAYSVDERVDSDSKSEVEALAEQLSEEEEEEELWGEWEVTEGERGLVPRTEVPGRKQSKRRLSSEKRDINFRRQARWSLTKENWKSGAR